MGTRSTTKIYNQNGKLVLALYKQYDGYPESWGAELKKFVKRGKIVNGLGSSRGLYEVFNGAGDLAAQLVCRYKTEPGYIYATTADDNQEYNYQIRVRDDGSIKVSCDEVPSFNEVFGGAGRQILPTMRKVKKHTRKLK